MKNIEIVEVDGKRFKRYPSEITRYCPECHSETHFCLEHQELDEYLYRNYTEKNIDPLTAKIKHIMWVNE